MTYHLFCRSKYKHKLIHGNFNANHVSKAVDKQDQKILDHLSYSKYIVETLECFMASSDSVITEDHVPEINEIANPLSSSDQQKLTKMVLSCIVIFVSFVSMSVYYCVNIVHILNCLDYLIVLFCYL